MKGIFILVITFLITNSANASYTGTTPNGSIDNISEPPPAVRTLKTPKIEKFAPVGSQYRKKNN